MKIGVCSGFDNLIDIKKTNCDYIELNLSSLVALEKSEFITLKKQLSDLDLTVKATNGFLPSNIKTVYKNKEIKTKQETIDYLKKAKYCLDELAIKNAVLGSSASRNLFDDITIDEALKMFCDFLYKASEIFIDTNICIEHLNKKETNFILTTIEAYEIINIVNKRNVNSMCDFYHFFNENEPITNINVIKDRLKHIHIANPVTRVTPLINDNFDYSIIKNKLCEIGYDETISIEGNIIDYPTLTKSINYLQKIFN